MLSTCISTDEAGLQSALQPAQFAAIPGQALNPTSTPTGASSASIQALVSGSQWAPGAGGKTVITYSFGTTASQFGSESVGYASTLLEFSAADKAMTRTLLGTIEAVANVSFVEVADAGGQSGQMRYAYSQAPNDVGYGAFAFYPSQPGSGGDVWIGRAQAAAQWDYYRPNLVLHETLHAMGLKHPFEGNTRLDTQSDIIPNTVMSYSAMTGSSVGALNNYPTQPMALDVAALQAIYGAAGHNTGDTVYNLAQGSFQAGFVALWDSSGQDTWDASGIGHAVTLDLREGGQSSVGVRINANAYYGTGAERVMNTTTYTSTLTVTAGTQVEHAVGTAFSDVIVGNASANYLVGGAGDDALYGWGGNDYFLGGAGNDSIDGGAGTDTALFAGNIANFKVEKSANGIVITDRLGGQGTDSLAGVEKVRFNDLSVDLTVQDIAASVSAARLQAVVELYVGFFNRVPDSEGLSYWVQQLNEGMTTATMADNFYAAALQYSSLTGYSSAMTNEDFVKVVYKNVLGRSSVDAEGLAYWSKALGDGSATRGALLESIIGSAHTFEGHAQFGYVADLLSNKYEVGKMFAVDMGLSWNTAEQSIAKGMEIAAAVTSTDIQAAVRLMGVTPLDFGITL